MSNQMNVTKLFQKDLTVIMFHIAKGFRIYS